MAAPPVALTIAGSDNSAGAGLQADLKTFTAQGCYGLTAVTCVVAEIPGRVEAVQPVGAALVSSQIALCMEAFPVRAAKTGMLYSEAIVRAVAEQLGGAGFPIIVDPVMVASSGDALLKPGAIRAYWKHLFPLAALITPNLDELAFLTGRTIRTRDAMVAAGRILHEETGRAILLKGGHLKSAVATDILLYDGGEISFSLPRIRNVSTHGTGCTCSAAIAAGMARGLPLVKAVSSAKNYLHQAIRTSFSWRPPGTRALHH